MLAKESYNPFCNLVTKMTCHHIQWKGVLRPCPHARKSDYTGCKYQEAASSWAACHSALGHLHMLLWTLGLPSLSHCWLSWHRGLLEHIESHSNTTLTCNNALDRHSHNCKLPNYTLNLKKKKKMCPNPLVPLLDSKSSTGYLSTTLQKVALTSYC